jgi:hypothetical protein
LKEYIEALDNTPQLRDFYNQEILEIKSTLLEQIKKIQDPIIKIKLKEIYKTIKEIDKRSNITNNHLVDLLQFQSLIEEITKTL